MRPPQVTGALSFRLGVTPAPPSYSLGAGICLHEAQVARHRAAADGSELDCLGWGLDLPLGPCLHPSAWVE